MTPSVNVNLAYNPRDPHDGEAQVLIPCPIPRSATFDVVLGACVCGGHVGRGPPAIMDRRSATCPARPVRVSCSISGKTWEESEVMTETDERPALTNEQRFLAAHACNARWALVKALVLGQHVGLPPSLAGNHPAVLNLFLQRDAVYAALADMVRHENGLDEAKDGACAAFPSRQDGSCFGRRPSEAMMASYAEHLIEQVGVLP